MCETVELEERIVALMLIAGAFDLARRPLPYDQEAVFGMRIRDAYRDGVRGPEELAFAALQREGYCPVWSGRGNIRTIHIGATPEGLPRAA